MKSLEQILKTKPVFLHNWEEDKSFGVIADFNDICISQKEYCAKEAPYVNSDYWQNAKSKMDDALKQWADIKILFASYSIEGYDGDAFVLFSQNGELFEVNGSYCSYYGLEDQWKPEKVVLEELGNRLINGTFGKDYYEGNSFNAELRTFLGIE